MSDEKSSTVFDFGNASVTFGGSVVVGDQVGVTGGVVYGDVVVGGPAAESSEDE
ncbi:hypothetical protein LHJ74_05370 [Streptomyces sp. N2-109]|uniref:Uncharacterized protein n=1 Tax=Streptomyces gossypii TaxID=2883101 RepID=A0ABT2JPC5_9ACTN|nr:hypothetical protein [Streptomyces gossypii]MCT2589369.1 hypothetical protein [Streptomyces gossypii]